ncbi:MAG: 6-phosphogluconolactonase [Solirubrobacteraceae bacterium]
MKRSTLETPEAVARAAAECLAELLADALARRGVAHAALTGGTSAGPVYERLAPLLPSWRDVHLWWGDERCVAPGDADANYAIGARTLIEPQGIPAVHVHRMRGELGPEEGARAYAAELSEHVPADASGMPRLDVVDLGLGPDGHVASLFPNHPALDVDDVPATGVRGAPKPPPERITLTVPALRAARQCVIHTAGADRRDAVERLLGPASADTPASLLDPDRLLVIVDRAAAP